ncbi:MAG TPA: homoserine dehydrogenase [Bacteroidia bacterium]|jgi:homoserine dehydrogenase|nr:homoserine dehydrogenase [Bacteroidia bacterium]
MAKDLKIGLFGFGCVGQGLYHVLKNSKGFKADIVKIAVKNKTKQRPLDKGVFTFDKYEILDNPEIDVIVELIDDAEEAFNIISYALSKGKHVVTANKKMVAQHLQELFDLQHKNNVSLLYEASSCGSIPIIRTLEEYFDNEQIEKVSGIFNGTTNYILTKTINEKLSYPDALKQAQEKGFAESDPTNDVEGFDAKFKAIIIALHAFGIFAKPEDVLNIGISTLHPNDITYAQEKNYKIKLVPTVKKVNGNQVSVFVLPKYVDAQNHLFSVDNEFNGVIVGGEFSGEQFLKGKGAGGHPTGAAVLSDISALSYGYKYEYKKQHQNPYLEFTNDVIVKVYFRYNRLIDLEKLNFEKITERYSSGEYNYVIGYLALENIIANKEHILKNNLFVALVGEEIQQTLKTGEKEKKSLALSTNA